MYANIVFTDENQEQDAEMRQYVVETILPGVEKTPGFVYGMWFAPAQSKGVSVTIWENQELAEEAVRGLLARVETTPIPGSTIYRIDTVEVIGETGRPIQAR